MADNDDPEISAALAKLAELDPTAADDAAAALRWIAGEQGLAAVTQEGVQTFCWYQLPMKWLDGDDEKLRVVAALAEAFELLQLPRYAAICRSPTTRGILGAYEQSPRLGKAAFRRAAAASGITPPDLPEFQWGAVMGVQEAAAWSSAADFLEVAVASSAVVPGTRGWKTRQQELVRAHLATARLDLLGQTYAQAIVTERAETWVSSRRSETRRRIVAAIANRLLHPAQLPAGTTEPLPRLQWLLGQLADGVGITVRGNLNRSFVQQSAGRFGWDLDRPPRSEDDLFDLSELRQLAQELGLARRAGRTLILTAKGRHLAADAEQMWRLAAASLLAGDDAFSVFAGELFLALLLDVDSLPLDKIAARAQRAANEAGFRDFRTGKPPSADHVRWVIYDTINLCRALGLLAVGADWNEDSYGLTATGKASALEALRARATGPRTNPLP
ncbi:MAG: hypothetical protein ACRDOK_16115 [Streptosporangiaceae bacterium]